MLIVSENEDKIVNLDKIEMLGYIPEENLKEFYKITVETASGYWVLANNKTELECKEILQEIVDYYCSGKKVYYIPEE